MVELAGASFLGFKIVKGNVRWTTKSEKKFKAKVKKITLLAQSAPKSEAAPQSPEG